MQIIQKHFSNLSELQKEQFAQLLPLYQDWNSKINVISRKDMEQFYEHHVLHSLGIAKVIQFKPGTKVLDVGTGGGFPGIPLAILFPETDFFLADSIGKKIKVVKAVAEAIGLKNLRAEQIRAEEIKEQFDFVVSRAVAELSMFHTWVRNKFRKENFNDMPNGILCLKGGDLTEELAPFKGKATAIDLKNYFREDYFDTKKVVYLPA